MGKPEPTEGAVALLANISLSLSAAPSAQHPQLSTPTSGVSAATEMF